MKKSPLPPVGAKSSKQRELELAQLPEFLEQACLFSDDPDLVNERWVMESIERELTTKDGTGIWDRVREATTFDKGEGRKRADGDWTLLYAGFVLSARSEMSKFHAKNGADDLFAAAGFNRKMSYPSLYLRFTELEAEQCVEAINAAADELIKIARSHEPRIGETISIDSTAFHSRAVLHHDCPDKAKCRELDQAKAVLDVARDDLVQAERQAMNKEAPTDDERSPDAPLSTEPLPGDRYPNYFIIKGHRYGCLDPSAGVRHLGKDAKKGKFWIGGLGGIAVDTFTGALLSGQATPAGRQEHHSFFELMNRVEKATGSKPDAFTGDRGLSVNSVFEWAACNRVSPVLPFRKAGKGVEHREDLRSIHADEHGVVRCKYCGGPCTQDGPRLGLALDRKKQPRFKVRCQLGITPECRTKTQTISPTDVPHGWRLLIRTSRITERYHALRQLHQNAAEGEFANARKRYALFGNDMTGKLKRFGIEAQELRLAMARFLEWFRLCLRHGWIGNHARINTRLPITRRGEKRLRATLLARRERNLNLPYGPAAFALKLAPDGALPPKLKRRPPDLGPPAIFTSSGANN